MFFKIVIALAAALTASALAADDCSGCINVKLESDGSFAEEYPRYIGVWTSSGHYSDFPFFLCYSDCMGLRNYLMYLEDPTDKSQGYWAIVDCQPDDVACGGGPHKFLQSVSAPKGEKCPWNANGPWQFCSGDITPGGGCTQYTVDETVRFTCV